MEKKKMEEKGNKKTKFKKRGKTIKDQTKGKL
jgi:hypothetical protein